MTTTFIYTKYKMFNASSQSIRNLRFKITMLRSTFYSKHLKIHI